MRTSTRRVCVLPSPLELCSCNTPQQALPAIRAEYRQSHPGKECPPFAASKRPNFCVTAPVNAPLRDQRAQLSRRPRGIAAQFNLMKGAIAAVAVGVNGVCDNLFASTRFALDKGQWQLGRRPRPNLIQYSAECPRLTLRYLQIRSGLLHGPATTLGVLQGKCTSCAL